MKKKILANVNFTKKIWRKASRIFSAKLWHSKDDDDRIKYQTKKRIININMHECWFDWILMHMSHSSWNSNGLCCLARMLHPMLSITWPFLLGFFFFPTENMLFDQAYCLNWHWTKHSNENVNRMPNSYRKKAFISRIIFATLNKIITWINRVFLLHILKILRTQTSSPSVNQVSVLLLMLIFFSLHVVSFYEQCPFSLCAHRNCHIDWFAINCVWIRCEIPQMSAS